MEKRKALLNKIARIISFYAATIQSNVESGRTDILIDAEKICCSLLNITFGFELKLLNQSKRNFPAIDMADEQRRVAVQVTSSNTRAKVQNTLNSFLEHGLNDQYNTLLVFILVAAPKFRQRVDFSVPGGMELRVMTFFDLIRELENVKRERLEEVAWYLEETIGTDKAGSSADAVPATVSTDVIKSLTKNARQVFNFAGFLPEAGLERNVFEYGLEPLQRKALPDLLEQGVLYQKDMIIHLHPNVRNQAQAQAVQDHALFLDRLWDYEKSWHWDRVSLSREIALQRSLAQVYALAAELFPEWTVVYALRSAELYRNTQQYEQALRQEQKALQILESVEKDHWATARAHHFSGECYTVLQEYASALKEWEKTLKLCCDQLHASELDIAEAHHNVGRALTALKRYKDAEQELLTALKLLEDFRKSCPGFAPQPWMSEIYDSLATVYTKRDMNGYAALCSRNALLPPTEQEEIWYFLSMQFEHTVDEAELHRSTKALSKEQFIARSGLGGMGKTELAAAFNNAGYASADRGDYVQSLEYLQKALAIQKQALSLDHPDIAATYENMGYTYENMGYTYADLGNHERALEYHSKALAIRKKVLPVMHPSIALSYHNIAWVYYDMGDYQRALEYMRGAVDIAEKSLPEGHPERVKYRADLENLERDIQQ